MPSESRRRPLKTLKIFRQDAQLDSVFGDPVSSILNEANSYYIWPLLSKRAGDHEIESNSWKPKTVRMKPLAEYDFNADDFTGGCDITDFECENPTDNDGDGFRVCDGDCDDNDPALNLLDDDGEVLHSDNDCDDSIAETPAATEVWYDEPAKL